MPRKRSEAAAVEERRPFFKAQPGKVPISDRSSLRSAYYRKARTFRWEEQTEPMVEPNDLLSKEDLIQQLQTVVRRAAQSGDFQSEIRALRELAQLQGFDVWQNIADIKRVSQDQLLDFFKTIGIPRMRAYMIDILDPKIFEPIVKVLWDHEIPLPDAAQFVVESLRLAATVPMRGAGAKKNRTRGAKSLDVSEKPTEMAR